MIGRDWAGMTAADFDAAAPLTLMPLGACTVGPRPSDAAGTPDMFADAGL